MRTAYSAIVTFEYDLAAPQTWRGEIVAGEPSTAVSRAVKRAKQAYPNTRYRSLVVVLEKAGESDAVGQVA